MWGSLGILFFIVMMLYMSDKSIPFNSNFSIDDFRGACAVKGNVQVAGHVKRVDHRDAFNA